MMIGKYCNFKPGQLEDFKKRLHSKIHWLLVYKEADDCDFFFDYFQSVLDYVGGLNDLLDNSSCVINLLITLQVALNEAKKKDCNFKLFRKNIFEAHGIVDQIIGHMGGGQHDNSAELPKNIG